MPWYVFFGLYPAVIYVALSAASAPLVLVGLRLAPRGLSFSQSSDRIVVFENLV
jgi:hypothetical protein